LGRLRQVSQSLERVSFRWVNSENLLRPPLKESIGWLRWWFAPAALQNKGMPTTRDIPVMDLGFRCRMQDWEHLEDPSFACRIS